MRYWQWPQWDKQGLYFSANKTLGSTAYLRARVFYDRFDNLLRSFDDDRYATQTRPFAFNSVFDDDTYGTVLEVGTGALPRQTLKGSFYYKDDTHREANIGEPNRTFRDQSFSWGLEDTLRIGERSTVSLGMSLDYLSVRQAQDFQNGQILPFPTDTSWAFNPQVGWLFDVSSSGQLRASFAHKTRMPTIKDRYSYRLGRAIPNPELVPEAARHYEIGYSHLLRKVTRLELTFFRSDIDDTVQSVFIRPNVFQLQNVGEAVYSGAELSAQSQVTSFLQVNTSYTFLNRRIESVPAFTPLDTPRHKAHAALEWRTLRVLRLLADIRYEAGRYGANPAGTVSSSPEFADVGVHGTVDIAKGLSLQSGSHNLLDRNYWLVEGYPEPGRTVYGRLRYHF